MNSFRCFKCGEDNPNCICMDRIEGLTKIVDMQKIKEAVQSIFSDLRKEFDDDEILEFVHQLIQESIPKAEENQDG